MKKFEEKEIDGITYLGKKDKIINLVIYILLLSPLVLSVLAWALLKK